MIIKKDIKGFNMRMSIIILINIQNNQNKNNFEIIMKEIEKDLI